MRGGQEILTQEEPKTNEDSRVEELSAKVPGEIRRAIRGLCGDRELAVFVLLVDENGLAFSELESHLVMHQQQLTNTLSHMQDAGIVVREDIVDSRNGYTTNYRVTNFGIRLMDSLHSAVNPRKNIEPEPMVIDLFNRDFERDVEASDIYVSVETTQKQQTARRDLDGATEVEPYAGERQTTQPPEVPS